MGCGSSTPKSDSTIDKDLNKSLRRSRREAKLLLLGAGESGKSTVLKQMKILHQGGYSESERFAYREIVWSNAVQSMQVLARGIDILGLEYDDADLKQKLEKILAVEPLSADFIFTTQIGDLISSLWAHPVIQNVYARSSELQLNDSAKYFFEAVERLAMKDYIPSEADVLRSRVKSTGISESTFIFGEQLFRVYDVGGQRSERRKWIHCFEDVTAVLFCVALSEYDLVLREDESQNRMQEALQLFDSICNSRWFAETSIILFLNKTDLFADKLARVPLTQCFPDFANGNDVPKAISFIEHKFIELNKTPEAKQIYPHQTCATNTENIRFVWTAVNDIVTTASLRKAGLL